METLPKQETCKHDFVIKFGETECQECGISESEVLNSNSKRMYSEEEVEDIIREALQSALVTVDLEQWFKQFKKK